MEGPAHPPSHSFQRAPSPSLSPSPSSSATIAAVLGRGTNARNHPFKQSIYFSPPLIAMVAIVAAAFLLVAYSRLISRRLFPPFLRLWRRWRRRRRQSQFYSASSSGDIESRVGDAFHAAVLDEDGFHAFSPYGLDEAIINTIPLSIYHAAVKNRRSSTGEIRDCAVCLLEFEDDDCVRTLPVCSHAFHVDCIDIWLRSHANCPLCRAGIFRPDSPFIPLMAERIRPSLDGILDAIVRGPPESEAIAASEIRPTHEEPSPRRINIQSDDHLPSNNGRDFLLKRSYSFGFERNFPSERLTMEPATASPWRYRRGSFWNKRPSPFGSLMSKPRVFSFRYYRGMKSPFFRRRGGASGGGSFYPLSESGARFGGGGSSRRSKSMTSPMFARPGVGFPSSRLRCGDLEALLSPDRYNRR